MRPLFGILTLSLLSHQALANDWPQTTAERSGFQQTSSHQDVMDFLRTLQAKGAPIRLQIMGNSHLGKPMPLVVCHANPDITPDLAKRKGLPVVYVQANIHGGEVEGKETVLMLLRELAQNPKHPILNRIVIVATPIYNIDGNDKWGPNKVNRGHQDGPEPVGERANGQGYDLNRDCIKAFSPEMQAVLSHVYKPWDPDVIMDLHTTNGTRHGYELTYSAGLNPTCDDAVTKYTFGLLNRIRRDPKLNGGFKMFDYGDASRRDRQWVYSTFAAEPRYVTNYASVRNRIGVLSEAASFQPFETRVKSTYVFLKSVLGEIARESGKVVRLIREADDRMAKRVGTEVGIRFAPKSRGKESVLLEVERPASEIDHMKAPTAYRTLEMEIFDRFTSTKTAKMPFAYIIKADQRPVIDLLLLQGIQVERIDLGQSVPATMFNITKANIAGSPFQGRRLQSLEGEHVAANVDAAGGDYLVRTSQPLGLLAFHILEPESTDGALAWGFFGEPFDATKGYPVVKLMQSMNFTTTVLP